MIKTGKTIVSARLLWSLILGLGLALGLLWVLTPRSAAEVRSANSGSTANFADGASWERMAPGDGALRALTSDDVPLSSVPLPAPPRDGAEVSAGSLSLGSGSSAFTPPSAGTAGDQGVPLALSRAEGGTDSGDSDWSGMPSAALLSTSSFTEPYVLLEKNDDYYDASSVVFTQVTGLLIDEDEAWARYQIGQLDDIVLPLSALDEITSGSTYSTQLHVYPRPCVYYYGFSNDVPPFDDPLVRAAFASAIDRQQLINDVLNGDELEALTFAPPGTFGYVDGYAAGIGRPYSPTLAVSLLAASSYSTGTPPITLMYNTSPDHQAVAEAVRQMWIDTLGITVTLQSMDFNSYLDLIRNGSVSERPGVWRLGWCGDYPDANNWHKDSIKNNNLPHYTSPAYDALVDAAAGEIVTSTRLSQYKDAEAYLVMTDTIIVPLYHYVDRSLTRPDLTRTYRPFRGQHIEEWNSGAPHPLEVAWGALHTLDPAFAFDSYVEQLFLGLTDFDEQGNPVPELATSWEVSPDARVYTFTMRSGVMWTNSISPVTAYDVEYGVLRSLDPNTGSGLAYILYSIENAADYNQGNITDTNQIGVKALDATHIRFTLAGPAAYFPVVAGLPPARPVPQWAIDAHGGGWTDAGNIVTNGPYKLAAWQQAPHLRVEKRADEGDPLSGSDFVFTIEYWNDGGAPAEATVITDTMVGGLTYISDTAPFTHTGSGNGPIVWYLGAQPAHSSGQFDVHVQVTASASETITNTAQIATANPYDQGDLWEKESQWIGHVEGPRMRVDYADDFVGGIYPAGHTLWLTVTDSASVVKATAIVSTEVDGAGHGYWGYDGFVTEGSDWSSSQPDIQPGDWVHFQSDDGYTNTMRIGTISGELDVDADTISGTIHAPWFPNQTLQGCTGGWGTPGWENFTVDLDGTGTGHYFAQFSEDVQPGWSLNVEYIEPDGDKVISAVWDEVWKVRVNQSHRWVDGETMPGSTIVATVWRDGLPIIAETTHNGGDTWWHINFPGDNDFQLQVGDVVDVQTSQGLTASVEIIPMSGSVDANADTISGQISGVSNADVRGEVWARNGVEKDGQTDGAGNYAIHFDSFDVLPGHMVALWYVRPDGHQVGIVRHALWLDVNTMRDEVGGETWANVPVTVTVNGGETLATTSDAKGQFWIEFTTDIASGDMIEGWAGTGTQYVSLTVETVTAYVDDAQDKVWGYGPPNDGWYDNINVGLDGDWRWTSTDSSGYYEVQYDYDITSDDDLEIEYEYPERHRARYGFGPSDVSVGKDANLQNASPGDELSFFINYSNDASGPATDVIITDTLPYSMTYLWDTGPVTPITDPVHNTVVWQLGRLATYRSWEFEVRVRVETGAPMYTSLRNEVEISDPNDRNPGNNHSSWNVNIQDPQADLWVEKSLGEGDDSENGSSANQVLAGEVVTYQIHYGNNGNQTASGVILTDTLPASVTLVTTTFEVGVDGVSEDVGTPGVVVWDIGSLDSGESQQFELVLQVISGTAPGTLLPNEVIIGGDNDGGETRDNRFLLTAAVAPQEADLWVDKVMEGDFSATSNEFAYHIVFYNDGPLAAQDVVITDTLPVSMTHLWHSAGSAATVSNGAVVWQLGAVPPGVGGQLAVGVRVSGTIPVGAVFTNTVEGSTGTPELDYDNNQAVDLLGPPRAICVPWIGTRPHPVWSGLNATLKGTAKGYGLTAFEWDPGDGSPVYTGGIGNPYAIEAMHTYTAPVDTVYTATLTVWGAFGWSDADTYAVKVFAPIHGVEVDVAIDEGLWYIHKEADRYRSGGLPLADWQTGGNGVAETASAIQAFQVQGHRPGGDPWEDPYVEDVQRGWNTLFTYAMLDMMNMESAGDPDGDGDGVGVGMYMDYGHSIYESGLSMMALATTGSPNRVAHTGPPIHVRGRTYLSITQDMADWFAWGQNDDWSGWARGGWRYQPNSGDSDNSNTQFPVLGLIAAEENWGITVPSWVKDELLTYWLSRTQNSEGAFGYSSPDGMPNVGKTGAGIMDLAWAGAPITGTQIVSASQYIETHWNDPIDMNNQGGNVGDYYAMYAVKKGSQVAGIHYYGPYLWDYEYTSYLLGIQSPDGRFDEDPNLGLYFNNWQPMGTSWAVMILSPGLYRPLPVPILSPVHYGGIGAAWNDGEIVFDASLSHHTDPDRTIVLYEWDFGDGSVMTSTNPIVTHTYGTRGVYVAVLTAWDDLNNGAARATQVNITAPNGPPVADPGGPYNGLLGQQIVLDGSGSYDPDETVGDAVVLYEWNIAGSLYTTTVPTLARTWFTAGAFSVTLRVRDRGAEYGLDSPKWSDPAATTVVIDQHIAGLVATNDGPTSLGDPTTLEATVLAGTGVDYAWDFGDGETGSGAVVMHTYSSVGAYTAVVTASNSAGELVATTVVTVHLRADLSLSKSDSPDPVVVGNALTYTLTVVNNGPLTATNVTIIDTLPAGASYASASTGCVESGGVVTCYRANLSPDSVMTVTIVVTPNVVGTIINTAIVTADEYDPDPSNNSDSESTIVTAVPVLDPIVTSIAPNSGFKDETTVVIIEGGNFQTGATASLDGTALQSVSVVNSNLLQATVPAGLTPDIYDLTIVNPDTRSGVLLDAFTVMIPTPPVVTSVTPPQGPNDMPVTIDIYGGNFATGLTATLELNETQVLLEGVLLVDGSHLRAIVPIYVASGVYTLTVTNSDGRSGMLPSAYEAVDASLNDDLYANRADFWLRPLSVREGGPVAPVIGMTVHRQSGQADLTNVQVSFYDGNPLAGGSLISTGTLPTLTARGAATTTVPWVPAPTAGTYALYAVIDPADEVTETNEANNVVSRTVTVLPPLPDTTPPVVDGFSVNGGAANTSDQLVYLDTLAHDDPGGRGLASVLYVEYEFIQSVADWVPVASSGWLPYDTASINYPWLLQPSPGVRYLKVWVADGAGNISLMSKAQMINYVPPSAYVAQGQVHIYRQYLTAGQTVRVKLTMSHGDADLYVWSPLGALVAYSWADNPEDVTFMVPPGGDGVYQIEVEGWTGAYYQLEIIQVTTLQMQAMSMLRPLRGRSEPFLMPDNTPDEDVGLPSAPVTRYLIYLPLVMR